MTGMREAIVRGTLGPLLKRQDFRRRGTTWNRTLDELVHVVQLQTGRMAAWLSINVGIYLPLVDSVVRNEAPPSFVATYRCQVSSTLAHIAQEGFGARVTGTWGSHFDAELGREMLVAVESGEAMGLEAVADAVERYVLPAFQSMRSLTAVWQTISPTGVGRGWRANGSWAVPILEARFGDREAARRAFQVRVAALPPAYLAHNQESLARVAAWLGLPTVGASVPPETC